MAMKIYGKSKISERHRHRFEVNINYKNEFKYEDGICPKLNDSVHSGVVVAHLVKLVMTNGNLEQFQNEID